MLKFLKYEKFLKNNYLYFTFQLSLNFSKINMTYVKESINIIQCNIFILFVIMFPII